jgi:4-diphosphocytidyl-2-C-methyl-D-erythritol kinase
LYLRKFIPHGAGLGGGSSDAAATLRGLNQLCHYPFNYQQLWEMARRLGADVPFFLRGGSALCTGIGEQVKILPDFPRLHYVLLKPPLSLATATIYAQVKLKDLPKKTGISIIAKSSADCKIEASRLSNDLEVAAAPFYRELGEIKAEILALGAAGALMSGSGTTVFGIFDSAEQSSKACSQLRERKPAAWWVTYCQGTTEYS